MRTYLLLGLLTALCGCATPPGGWGSPEPASRLGAITDAAKSGDHSAIPYLIESLGHDDPVVRMAALRTLEQLTGQTLGYDYAAPEWERRDKIAAWVGWYRAQSPDNSRPQPAARTSAAAQPIERGWARR